MDAPETFRKSRIELLPSQLEPSDSNSSGALRDALPEPLLYRNLTWFIRLRWAVVFILAAFGLLGTVPGIFRAVGLRPYVAWPIATAALLALANLGILWHAKKLERKPTAHGDRVNLSFQIFVDLLFLTVVVHFVGSLETYVPFAYLFHVVLACIFFGRSDSFVVTVAACAFYVACVCLELAGVLPPAGILADGVLRDHIQRNSGTVFIYVASATTIWMMVWYLASHLSGMVRQRDRKLLETNRRLVELQEERTRHLLRTTHELKAPFAAIDANAQILLKGYCGRLPEKAVEVVERIGERCRKLAAEIQEMLQLANLRFVDEESLEWTEVDPADVLEWSARQLQPLAQEKKVSLELELRSAPVRAIEDHMKMIFNNIISNAILYSKEGGRVRISCGSVDGAPTVTVEDDGIGIHPEKLPKIFEEYYRAEEAVQYNKRATGLGLTIVRHVARSHGIRICVESSLGAGTKFVLSFPRIKR